MERPLRIDLPRDSAFSASRAAFLLQVALRLSLLDLEVFFLGTAMTTDTEISNFYSLSILGHKNLTRTLGAAGGDKGDNGTRGTRDTREKNQFLHPTCATSYEELWRTALRITCRSCI